MSGQISVAETIEAIEDGKLSGIIKVSNEIPEYRYQLGGSVEFWNFIAKNVRLSILPLIANIAASQKGNELANLTQVPQILISMCDELCGHRSYWSALSNSSQMYPVEAGPSVRHQVLEKLTKFPNIVIQFVSGQVRNGMRDGWDQFIYKSLDLYSDWYAQGLTAVDLFNNLMISYVDNGDILKFLNDDNLILYKVLDAVQQLRSGPIPLEFTTRIYQRFDGLVNNSQKLFSERNETFWPIFILQMEILTSIMESDPDVKYTLTNHGIVQTIVTLLANSKQYLPVYNKLNAAPTELDIKDFPMVRSTAISLLSQVVVQNPEAQDQARELSGLALVLESCVIDANNPYIKERAVICVRYLLEHNQKNQDYVQSLEAKQVADPEVLKKAGFEVEFVNGKMVVKGKKTAM